MMMPVLSPTGLRAMEAGGYHALRMECPPELEADGRCPLVGAVADTLFEVLAPAERPLLQPLAAAIATSRQPAAAAARAGALVHYAVTDLMAALLDGPDPHRAGRVRRLSSVASMGRSADLGTTQWELGAAAMWCLQDRPDLATQTVCRWLVVAADVNLGSAGEHLIVRARPAPALSASALIGCLDAMLGIGPGQVLSISQPGSHPFGAVGAR